MLEVIAILVLIYLAFRVLTAFVLPFMVKRYLNRVKKKYYQNNPSFNQNKESGKGGVTITYNERKNRGTTGNLGEYTDFEEIKGDK